MRRIFILVLTLTILLSCKKTIIEELSGDSFRVSILPVSMKNFNFYHISGTLDLRLVNEPVEYGIVYGKTLNPDVENSTRMILGTAEESTDFSTRISDLDTGSTYYVRAYIVGRYEKIEYSANQMIGKISPTIRLIDTALHYGRTFSFFVNLPGLLEGTPVKVALGEHEISEVDLHSDNANMMVTARVPDVLKPGKYELSLTIGKIKVIYRKLIPLFEGTWEQVDDLPDVSGAEAFVHGDWIYLYRLNHSNTNTQAEFFKYNFRTRTRVQLKTIDPNYRLEKPGIAEINGKLHFVTGKWIGGLRSGVLTTRHYVYDIEADEWTREQDFPGGDRFSSVCTSYGGKLYFGMGWFVDDAGIVPSKPFNDMWCYDPSNKTWRKSAGFPKQDGRDLFSTFRVGSRLYLVAGTANYNKETYNSMPTKEMWCFDMANEQWTQKADYPGKGEVSLASFSIGDNGYAGMGESVYRSYDRNLSQEMFKYSPTVDKWTEVGSLGMGILKPITVSGPDFALLGGGESANYNSYRSLYIYKP